MTITLISGNGYEYARECPIIRICGPFDETATAWLIKQTGIEFKKTAWGNLEGKPETWEQFAKVFMTYNWITRDQNNADGNVLTLRYAHAMPFNAELYYEQGGRKMLAVDGIKY